MSHQNLQQPFNNYTAALKQKQDGTLPRFEEELWRHCCSYYHSSVPNCDLCRPRSNEQRMAIKEQISQSGLEQKQNRKRKVSMSETSETDGVKLSDVKRKKNTERRAANRKSLTSEAKERIKQKKQRIPSFKKKIIDIRN